MATHYHPDHIGLISELMKQGAKLLLIDAQSPHIHFSDNIFRRDKRLEYQSINIDDSIIINIKDSRDFLKNMGIEGEIIDRKSVV